MKNGKNATRKQRQLMQSEGKDPSEYKVVKDTSDEMVIVHVTSGKQVKIQK